jgi:hypothetical protein
MAHVVRQDREPMRSGGRPNDEVFPLDHVRSSGLGQVCQSECDGCIDWEETLAEMRQQILTQGFDLTGAFHPAVAAQLQDPGFDLRECNRAEREVPVVVLHPSYDGGGPLPTPRVKERDDVRVEQVHAQA